MILVDTSVWVDYLRPGMQVTAEVKTGQRRIIAYLLEPVLKGFKESVRER